jgi:hypothetical protein
MLLFPERLYKYSVIAVGSAETVETGQEFACRNSAGNTLKKLGATASNLTDALATPPRFVTETLVMPLLIVAMSNDEYVKPAINGD